MAAVWQIACREEEIPEVGDFLNYEILAESILLVRVAPDEIKAFYNVCQHRGRRLIDNRSGNVARTGFHCGFHGWRYGLTGNLAYVHDRKDWANCPDFDPKRLSLKEPTVGRWGGWVWINMDRDAEPLLDYLGEFTKVLANFELEKLRFRFYESIIAPVNWKVVVEAFNEGYHAGATHVDQIGYGTMHSPAVVHGRHTMYYTLFDTMPQVRKNGQWVSPGTWPEFLYLQLLELHDKLHAMVLDPDMRAAERVRAECPPDSTLEQVVIAYFRFQREELEKTGAEWPEKLTLEGGFQGRDRLAHLSEHDHVADRRTACCGTGCARTADNPDQCIFDIWCLERVPKSAPRKRIQTTRVAWLRSVSRQQPVPRAGLRQHGRRQRGHEVTRLGRCAHESRAGAVDQPLPCRAATAISRRVDRMALELLAEGYAFIEAPRVDTHNNLYFSDIVLGGVYRRSPDGKIDHLIPDRKWIGGLALNADGRLVVSGRGGLVLFDPRTGAREPLFDTLDGVAVGSINDIQPDGLGGLYAGMIDPAAQMLAKAEPQPLVHIAPIAGCVALPKASRSRMALDSVQTDVCCIRRRPSTGCSRTTVRPMAASPIVGSRCSIR